MFSQRLNRLTLHFLERIPVVKRRVSVITFILVFNTRIQNIIRITFRYYVRHLTSNKLYSLDCYMMLLYAKDPKQFTFITIYFSTQKLLIGSRFNPLKTKRRLLYLKTQSVPRCKHFLPRL